MAYEKNRGDYFLRYYTRNIDALASWNFLLLQLKQLKRTTGNNSVLKSRIMAHQDIRIKRKQTYCYFQNCRNSARLELRSQVLHEMSEVSPTDNFVICQDYSLGCSGYSRSDSPPTFQRKFWAESFGNLCRTKFWMTMSSSQWCENSFYRRILFLIYRR